MGSVTDAGWRLPRTGGRRGSRSPAHARGSPCWVCCRCCVNAMFGWPPGGQPRMGPAPANPTAHREGRGGALAVHPAPNPLLGRWFGCPGAGPIRACHRACSPATVLTNKCQHDKPLQRERGPENGYPDRRPPPKVSTTHASTKHGSAPKNHGSKNGSTLVASSHRLQRHRFDA
jgi:hypothetical protein